MDINTLLEELINVIKWKYFTNIIALTSLTLPIILSALGLLIGLYRKYSSEKRLHVYQTKEDKIKLKKYYIQTKGGFDDPCDKEEIIESIDKNRINLINYFIHDVIHNDKYGKYFIVLADSGMGKTTFIQKLYLKYARKVFRRYKIQFFPLTNYFELDEIEKIADKYKTVLLLDALDEDKYAMQNYKNRVDKILKVTQEFYKVIITSRTQFFPNRESEPNKTGYITYGTGKKINHFHKIYLSPFSNTDVNKYIRKKFVLSYKKRIKAKKIIDKCPNLMARPMLLSHIDGLMKHDKEYNDINDIYEILIDEWISREPDNEDFDKELSIEFIKKVVLYMFKENKIYINIDELESLCSINDLSKIEPIYGRTKSLLNRNGLGEYKFAHRSIFEFLVSKLAIENVDMRERLLKMIIKNEIANIYYKYFSLKMIAAFRNNDCISCIFLYLTNEDLSGTILTEADLTGTILREANLARADLRGANLIRADLRETNLEGADLREANLRGTDLRGVNLEGADLRGVNLARIDLRGVNLARIDLRGVNLEGADLRETNLEGADLRETNLRGTDLRETNLEGADLRESDLRGAILRGTDLKNILVASAVFDIDIAEKLLKQKEVSGIETIKVYDISLRKFYTYVEFIRHRNNTKW